MRPDRAQSAAPSTAARDLQSAKKGTPSVRIKRQKRHPRQWTVGKLPTAADLSEAMRGGQRAVRVLTSAASRRGGPACGPIRTLYGAAAVLAPHALGQK